MKKVLLMVLMSGFVALSLFAPVFAADPADACDGAAANSTYCQSLKNPAPDPVSKDGVVGRVTDVLAFVAGFIAVFWIIIQAIKITTANGNSEKVSAARNGIIYAAVGLIVVVLARTLIKFALNRL